MRFLGFLNFLVTGHPFSPKEIDGVKGEISFKEAIESHLAWKSRLAEAVRGEGQSPDPREAGDDKSCALGRWLSGAGSRRYGHFDSFTDLREMHAEFHRVARKIAERQKDDPKRARQILQQELHPASERIVTRLEGLAHIFGH
jgi:hypothetical protein